ncbi:MAG: protein of unknown function containing DUF4290 domain [Bacteroidetes bacterium HLUCCA01]|nr:MAG: protein of unknown function containing DUF4290 domain [Bacteroidetes bacterium HLUCCA01]
MFLPHRKPKDYDCGYNLDLMVEALPRIQDLEERIAYANRIVGLIKQSHINWVDPQGNSRQAWDHFFEMATYHPEDYGIHNPYVTGAPDEAR